MKSVKWIWGVLLIAAMIVPAHAQLEIHYSFDDAAAGTATNTVGTAGTITGDSVYSTNSVVGGMSLDFDGNNDYISTNIDLGTTNEYTMSFWYNTDTGQSCCGSGALYYTDGSWGSDSLHSSLTSGSTAVWSEIHSGNQRASATAGSLNDWNHVVISFDNGTVTYTINGADATGTDNLSGSSARLATGQIGAWNGTRDYNGLFDDWAIWSESLSQSEAIAIYNLALSDLNYDAAEADALFGVFDGEESSATIDDMTWVAAADGTFDGALAGDVIDLGAGAYGLALNDVGGGVISQAVPEPASIALWLLGMGVVGFVARKRFRRR